MKSLRWRIPLAVLLFVLWMLLAAELEWAEAIIGALVACTIAALPLPGGAVYGELSLAPRRIVAGIAYVGVFLWAVVRSNIDVAFRVLAPELPINPGIVRVKTRLKSRVFLF